MDTLDKKQAIPDNLLRCVLELDIDENIKKSILHCVEQQQTSKGIRLLKQCRGEILNNLHGEQNRLYQIDFVLQKMK